MERPAWVPQGIDISVPSVSRIYDFYLGGSHNFEVDREAARRAMEFMPGLPTVMKANRAFMRRAVQFAMDEGISQFLDVEGQLVFLAPEPGTMTMVGLGIVGLLGHAWRARRRKA